MANGSYLVIVESPSKAKTIGKYLGEEYIVKASMGHLRDLPKSTMGVDIEGGFIPEYLPLEWKTSGWKRMPRAWAVFGWELPLGKSG